MNSKPSPRFSSNALVGRRKIAAVLALCWAMVTEAYWVLSIFSKNTGSPVGPTAEIAMNQLFFRASAAAASAALRAISRLIVSPQGGVAGRGGAAVGGFLGIARRAMGRRPRRRLRQRRGGEGHRHRCQQPCKYHSGHG